jgi:hypothetical protein
LISRKRHFQEKTLPGKDTSRKRHFQEKTLPGKDTSRKRHFQERYLNALQYDILPSVSLIVAFL